MSNTYEVRLTVGQRIRHAREGQNMEQRDVAAALHMDRSKVSNWERGVTRLDFESAKRLAAITAAPWWWLLGYESLDEAMKPAPKPMTGPDIEGEEGDRSTIWYGDFTCSEGIRWAA